MPSLEMLSRNANSHSTSLPCLLYGLQGNDATYLSFEWFNILRIRRTSESSKTHNKVVFQCMKVIVESLFWCLIPNVRPANRATYPGQRNIPNSINHSAYPNLKFLEAFLKLFALTSVCWKYHHLNLFFSSLLCNIVQYSIFPILSEAHLHFIESSELEFLGCASTS
eukprot:scaffold10685_cov77-Cylindrotheca_fusiformis.AAC.4